GSAVATALAGTAVPRVCFRGSGAVGGGFGDHRRIAGSEDEGLRQRRDSVGVFGWAAAGARLDLDAKDAKVRADRATVGGGNPTGIVRAQRQTLQAEAA